MDEPVCATATSIDQTFGNGPLDELVGAVRTLRDIEAQNRLALDDAIAALGRVYGVPSEKPEMADITAAIANDIATSTAAFTAQLGGVTCTENGQASSSSEARCRKEGCRQCEPALCTEIARLSGLASAECDGPSLTLSFAAVSGLSADQQTELQNRMSELEAHGTKILAAHARLSAIMDGRAFDTVFFDPSPILEIKNEFVVLTSADRAAEVGVEPGCLSYAVPFFTAGLAALGDVATDASYLLRDGNRFTGLLQQ